MRYRIGLILFFIVILLTEVSAQRSQINSSPILRIDPPNWWTDMKDHQLQLCVYGKNISGLAVKAEYPGFAIEKVNKVENPNYLFVDIALDPAIVKPGRVDIIFSDATHSYSHSYGIAQRSTAPGRCQGVDSRDLVYLIMPDRFANYTKTNDIFEKMNEHTINRDSMFYRHGGDLSGLMSRLDYIKDLGATTVWLTPVQENNQPLESYHGYAITDHYKIDPRFGDNEIYKAYITAAHTRHLKVMMDMVYNHVGSEHWFIKDLPMRDWIHQFDTFTKTNYRATALMDPYASDFDKNKMSNGWFAKHMPDLNQQNPYLAKYLIQNSLWWIESEGIDGFRFDTYTYSDLTFMSDLMKRVNLEYPSLTAVGELWDHCVPVEAMFQQHPKIGGIPDSHLTGMIDFQVYNAINEALSKPMGWTEGLSRIYYTLSQDLLYSDASKNLIFLDNHDLSRFYSMVGEDLRKWKMGIAFLLTTRGIPQLYYGTEILMKNYADPDGKVRSDFAGGWREDKVNKFSTSGRAPLENEAFDYVRVLARYREQSDVLQTGKLTQFVPENDTYVYFRSTDNKTMMIIMHYSDKTNRLNLSRFAEKTKGYKSYRNIMTGDAANLGSNMELGPYEVKVLELVR